MRVNPETISVGDAENHAWIRRQHRLFKCLRQANLPGAKTHVENPGKPTEQERPVNNHVLVGMAAGAQGMTGVRRWQRFMGVGLFHSSVEAHEGGVS